MWTENKNSEQKIEEKNCYGTLIAGIRNKIMQNDEVCGTAKGKSNPKGSAAAAPRQKGIDAPQQGKQLRDNKKNA